MVSLPQDVPPALLERALILLARQQGGTSAAARKAATELARWRNESALHEQALLLAQEAWQQTEAPGLRGHIALPSSDTGQARRRALTAALGVCTLLFTGHWLRPWTGSSQSFSTSRGQIRTELLADGTRVDLAALTSLTARLTSDQRQVSLDQGEARFSVTSDATRPFTVQTQWGTIRVVGTEFSVRSSADATFVEVAEGLVRVQASQSPAAGAPQLEAALSVELRRSDAVRMDKAGLGMITHIDPANVGAWRSGWLIFEGDDLVSAVARWNDYATKPIRIAEQDRAALRKLRLTARFSLGERDAFLKSLPRILPVRVAIQGDQTWVGPF